MRLARLTTLAMIALALLAAPLAVQAQPGPKVPQVGLLWFGARSSESSSAEAFMAGLRELGYVEGQNVVLHPRFAEGNQERLAAAAVELIRIGVDVIVTYGDVGVRAAKRATGTVPIVVALTGDLVEAGHAASLARPGGNVTGLVDTSPELSAKRVELLRDAVPAISRVAVLWNSSNRVKVLDYRMTQVAAQTLGVPLQSVEVRQTDDIGPAVAAAVRERAGALLVLSDALTNAHRSRIVELANEHRLPTMYFSREWVAAGGLMAYGPRWLDMYRRAATYVDRILRGAKPGDLPIEQPTKFEFVINREDREGAWADDPAGGARAGGRGDPVTPPICLDAAGRPRPRPLDLRPGGRPHAVPSRAPPPARVAPAPDAAHPRLVRLHDGVPSGARGGGWWQLVPIRESDQTVNPLRRYGPPKPR